MNKFIKFNELSGDISYLKASLIDGIVLGQAEIPVDKDDPEKGTKMKYFVSCLLGANRQTGEAFDSEKEQLERVEELKKLLEIQ